MRSSADILAAYESCNRRGTWSSRWERHRMTATALTHAAITAGLVTDRPDYAEAAGEEVLALAEHRGLADRSHNLYASVINHAALADIVTHAIRRSDEPWTKPTSPEPWWTPGCLLSPDGTKLRRLLCVSSWNDDRERAELRSWHCLGEMSVLGLPLQLIVAVLGPMRDCRRSSHWSKCLIHPYNKSLRFRLRTRQTVDGFKETWTPIRREEHADISREKWLQSMLDDGVLQEMLFVIDVPEPSPHLAQPIRSMARQKLVQARSRSLPEKQLTGCEWPHPCEFLRNCHGSPESQPSDADFDAVLETTSPIPARDSATQAPLVTLPTTLAPSSRHWPTG